jgi:hypothetical protein
MHLLIQLLKGMGNKSLPEISNFKFQMSILTLVILPLACSRAPEPDQKILSDQTTIHGIHDLVLNETQVRLANITVQKVSVKPVALTTMINARLTEN